MKKKKINTQIVGSWDVWGKEYFFLGFYTINLNRMDYQAVLSSRHWYVEGNQAVPACLRYAEALLLLIFRSIIVLNVSWVI